MTSRRSLQHSNQAKLISVKPVFISIRTVIGVGTLVAGTAKAHHGLFDTASIEASKRLIGINPRSTYTVPEIILEYFRERKTHGKMLQREWNQMLARYREAFPHEAEQVLSRMTGELDKIISQQLATLNSVDLRGLATREINGIVLERLWEWCPAMIGGGADLVNSNKVKYHESDVFGPATGFQGRFIRYGIREHAICATSNGLAGFAPGVFIPVTATFLMFYLYVGPSGSNHWELKDIRLTIEKGAPAVRIGALSGLQVIHCATHDSFGTNLST
jgi:dihydroxyacetone synthase